MTKFELTAIKYCPRLQKDLSIKDFQAFGIFGNIGGETGGLTALQEKNPTAQGSRGGYGWLQWTGPRRRKYESWCSKNGLDKSLDETNYQYLVFEILGEEKASLVALRKTNNIDEATEVFMSKNLRPGVPHLDTRKRWAHRAEAAVKRSPSNGVKEVTGAVIVGTTAAVASPTHYWPYIAAVTAVVVLGYLLFKYIRKNKNNV